MPDEVNNESVHRSNHHPAIDSDSLNRSVERAVVNQSFVDKAVEAINGLEFPAFKQEIINFAMQSTNHPVDEQVLSLLQTLNGYEAYRSLDHVRDAFEVNRPRTRQFDNDSPEVFVTQGYRESPAHTTPEQSRQSTPRTRNIEETKTNISPDSE